MGVKTGAIKQEAVPSGVDAGSRAARRAWRERLNNEASRKLLIGVLAAFLGGSFWGFSGTAASALFDVYHVDTMWLMSVRQLLAGALFMILILLFDRKRFVQLWTTPEHRRQQIIFTIFGAMDMIIRAPANSVTWLVPRQPAGIRKVV